MMTFFSFLPIIMVTVFLAFFGFLIISHQRDEEKKLKHKKHKQHR